MFSGLLVRLTRLALGQSANNDRCLVLFVFVGVLLRRIADNATSAGRRSRIVLKLDQFRSIYNSSGAEVPDIREQ